MKKKLKMGILKAERDDKWTFVKTTMPCMLFSLLAIVYLVLRVEGVVEEGSWLSKKVFIVPFITLPLIQILFFYFIANVTEYVNRKYGKEVLEILPDKFLIEDSWVQVAKSMDNADKIITDKLDTLGFTVGRYSTDSRKIVYRYNNNNKTIRDYEEFKQIKEVKNRIKFIRENMFKGCYKDRDGKFIYLTEEEVNENEEYAYLWLMELTKSPMLGRISVLYQMDTDKKQKLFAERPAEDLVEFFKPFEEFEQYIKGERVKRKDYKLRQKEIIKQKSKDEIDSLFKYGMDRVDKIHKVELYEHDREFLDVDIRDFK